MKGVYLFVLCLMFMYGSDARKTRTNGQCKLCPRNRSIKTVKIPRSILLTEFDRLFEGKPLYEIFFGTPAFPQFDVLIKPELIYTKLADRRYSRVLIGVTENEPETCQSFSWTADIVPGTDRTMFFIDRVAARDFLQVFFSSCPEQYVWFLRCFDWVEGNRCAFEDIQVGLHLTSIERNAIIPWEAIAKDLRKTGITFGSSELFSFFTYGKNELCTF